MTSPARSLSAVSDIHLTEPLHYLPRRALNGTKAPIHSAWRSRTGSAVNRDSPSTGRSDLDSRFRIYWSRKSRRQKTISVDALIRRFQKASVSVRYAWPCAS